MKKLPAHFIFRIIAITFLQYSNLFAQILAKDSLNTLWNQGYPFAYATYDSTNGTYQYKLGSLYQWGGIKNEGELKTDSALVEWISGIAYGKPFSYNDFNNSLIRLESSGWFESSCDPSLLKHPSRQRLFVRYCLNEKTINSIEGAFGTSRENQGHSTQGFINLELNNIMGKGRNLNFEGEWTPPITRLWLAYEELHFLNFPFDVSLQLFHYQDSLQRDQSAQIKISRSKFELFKPSFSTGYNVHRDSTNQIETWQHLGLGIDYGYLIPLRITESKLQVGYSIEIHQLDQTITRHMALSRIHIPILKQWVWQENHQFKMTWPYISDKRFFVYELGGHKNLRGYAPNTFLTHWFHYHSSSFALTINDFLQPGIFSDQAYFETIDYEKLFRYSYGFSLNFTSQNSRWIGNLSYGVTPKQEFSSGWIHFKIRHFF